MPQLRERKIIQHIPFRAWRGPASLVAWSTLKNRVDRPIPRWGLPIENAVRADLSGQILDTAVIGIGGRRLQRGIRLGLIANRLADRLSLLERECGE